jgi:class 3 adenylate cyclase
LALRIRTYTADNEIEGHAISMRIGINSGPMIAGIVGTHKFAYDLWGDVVNTASRMESNGLPGSIQVTESTRNLLRDGFEFESRGVVSIKGKGEMETFLLLDRRS